jgi:hypothetical protein
MSIINIDLSDTIVSWRNKNNQLATLVGDLTLLTTTVDSDIVGAINSIFASVDSDIAALQSLVTGNDSDLAVLDSSINDLTLNNLRNGYEGLDFQSGAYATIVIGRDAGTQLSTTKQEGDFNTIIGFQAGTKLNKSEQNTVVGYQALEDLDSSGTAFATGGSNTAIGYRAANRLRGGYQNTAVGQSAFGARDSASYNTAIGAITLGNVGTNYVEGNTGIGYRALDQLTSGNNNVAIGRAAGGLGYGSGWSGSNNTLIGYYAIPSTDSASNEITLGNGDVTRFRVPGAGIDNTSAALSGTTPTIDVSARDTYTLTTSGNTTFTFTNPPASPQVGTFSLIITAGGTHTLTWPGTVNWPNGLAPAAPASGDTDIYTFFTIDSGGAYYGFLAGDNVS